MQEERRPVRKPVWCFLCAHQILCHFLILPLVHFYVPKINALKGCYLCICKKVLGIYAHVIFRWKQIMPIQCLSKFALNRVTYWKDSTNKIIFMNIKNVSPSVVFWGDTKWNNLFSVTSWGLQIHALSSPHGTVLVWALITPHLCSSYTPLLAFSLPRMFSCHSLGSPHPTPHQEKLFIRCHLPFELSPTPSLHYPSTEWNPCCLCLFLSLCFLKPLQLFVYVPFSS